jgi:hypothetical protein
LDIRLRAETFELLLAAMEHIEIALVVPSIATTKLPSDRFAVINFPQLAVLRRELCLIYDPIAAEMRSNMRRAVPRLLRVLGQRMAKAAG